LPTAALRRAISARESNFFAAAASYPVTSRGFLVVTSIQIVFPFDRGIFSKVPFSILLPDPLLKIASQAGLPEGRPFAFLSEAQRTKPGKRGVYNR
jgi:hypothetical protein